MKKLLVILLAASSLAYATESSAPAAGSNCSKIAQKVTDKLASHNRTEVTLNYSADQAAKAKTCQAAILAKNGALKVNLNQVSGTDVFKFSK
ncbi:MAG: hypothetical protein K2X04_02265 [Burkholderiales bacterium]|jgi:hypothetical protein|nr:hypothetical protein [Burkholderiales bacterium]